MNSNELFAALFSAALSHENPESAPKAPERKPNYSKANAERKAQVFMEVAKDTKLMFDCFCNAGFSPEYAYGLTVAMIDKK